MSRTTTSFVYGLLLAQSGPAQSQSLIFLSKASEYAVEMARRDFKDANSGTVLPPAAPGGPPRPAVFVSCNDQVDPVRAANYLVNEIGVPAFIGPITSPAVQNVVSQVTIPHEALEIAPVASTVLLQRIQGKQFLFRTSATDEVQDDFTKAVINKYVEPWARAKYALPAPAQLKLSIVKRGDALGNGLASLLYPALEFNGQALAANGSNYLEVDYGARPDRRRRHRERRGAGGRVQAPHHRHRQHPGRGLGHGADRGGVDRAQLPAPLHHAAAGHRGRLQCESSAPTKTSGSAFYS